MAIPENWPIGVKLTEGVYYVEERKRLVIFLQDWRRSPECTLTSKDDLPLLFEAISWFVLAQPRKVVTDIRVYHVKTL